MNEQNAIKLQVRDWLSRSVPPAAARNVIGLPIAICSDIGNVRTENQDKAVVLRVQASPEKYFLVAVLCDGIGGMLEGENCAALAVSAFISSCIRNRKLSITDRLLLGVNDANLDVFREFQGEGGATLSAIILDSDGNLAGVNVGDSRIYALSEGELLQVSVDDTIAGQLKQQEHSSELSNRLLQYIGIGKDIEPHVLDFPQSKLIDSLLLTSDGVHFIGDRSLKALASQKATSLELSKRLVQVSKWYGGHDNSTNVMLTEVSKLSEFNQSVRTGTVQLWDSFGDVQFIGIEREPEQKEVLSDSNIEADNKPVDANATEEEPKEGRSTKKKVSNKKAPKTKPQLRIDFDE